MDADFRAEADWHPGLPPNRPAIGQVAASADDPTATFRYVGYFGTYAVREARRDGEKIVGVVEHHMESAYPPELLDEGPDRPFRITGDQLTLGDGRTSRRLLKRVS